MLLPEWMLKYKNHIDKEDFYPEKNPVDSLLLLHAINFSMNKDSMKFIHEYNKILDDYYGILRDHKRTLHFGTFPY